jgi:hypothetical protein
MPTTAAHGGQSAFAYQFADPFVAGPDHSPGLLVINHERLSPLIGDYFSDESSDLGFRDQQQLLNQVLLEYTAGTCLALSLSASRRSDFKCSSLVHGTNSFLFR